MLPRRCTTTASSPPPCARWHEGKGISRRRPRRWQQLDDEDDQAETAAGGRVMLSVQRSDELTSAATSIFHSTPANSSDVWSPEQILGELSLYRGSSAPARTIVNSLSAEPIHSMQAGVVHFMTALKMEYPHHSDAENGPTVVLGPANGGHDSVGMHPQHVEVIKTAGHVASLQNSNQHHHLSPKEDIQGANVLQVSHNNSHLLVCVCCFVSHG
ncbi:unnamed protein product [Soboliphyme baturini]|uniref:Uncharacterized protein n=1 Tax=Soboliphyme baturini TaxID=241478 RepID=A0A183INS4_9BILA|nr:unnamed protein product [Soboliphyme baturini]